MKNYLLEKNGQYGIYQSEETMAEIKQIFDEDVKKEMWETVDQIQRYAAKNNLEYVGFDMFYK